MKFIVYCRVSTASQGRSGLGIEAQRAAVQSHLNAVGGEMLAEFIEIESGKRNDRPQLANALRRCRLSGATLLVAKLDRLSRNAAFLMQLQESSVQFIAADMPQANSMTVGIMALMAQQERELISQRTKVALAAAKARGVKLGNPATLTNRDTSKATQARSEAAQSRNKEIALVIAELQADAGEALSLREIAAQLNAAGYRTARGAEFKPESVRRIMAAKKTTSSRKEAA